MKSTRKGSAIIGSGSVHSSCRLARPAMKSPVYKAAPDESGLAGFTRSGRPIDPVFTAESAENAEQFLNLCGLSVLRGEINTLDGN